MTAEEDKKSQFILRLTIPLRTSEIVINGYIRETEREYPLSMYTPDHVAKVMVSFYETANEDPIVIDNGSGLIKIGYAGKEEPQSVFPSVIGHSKPQSQQDPITAYVGDETSTKLDELKLNYPIECGFIYNWKNIQTLWSYAFSNKLKETYKGTSILMTEPPLNPKSKREKMTQIMFEDFEVSRFYVQLGEVLALYASGRTTGFHTFHHNPNINIKNCFSCNPGLIFSSGDSVSHTVPVYEGYALPHAILRMDCGGLDVTQKLRQLLREQGFSITKGLEGRSGMEICKHIKEKLCYIAVDYDEELEKDGIKRDYKLPDGQIISVDKARFIAPEIIFRPSLIGKSEMGLHRKLYNTVMKCDLDDRHEWYQNIVVVGGNTMFPGIKERLEKEMNYLVPDSYKIKTIIPPERKQSVWIGGSILASLSTFEEMWITRKEYDETGPSIVHRKCS